MQVGADIYCDTEVIGRRIESAHPEPSLFTDGIEGRATAISWWADKSILMPALGVLVDTIGDTIPPLRRRAPRFRLSQRLIVLLGLLK